MSGPGPRYRGAVCAIAKDENRYVLEWAAYHLALGFDHVFLYDNMSGRPLADAFDPAAARPFVTVTPWPTLHGRNAQLEAYGHFFASHGRDTDWAAVIDLDEMINLKRHAGIRDFLADHAGADGVALNWRVFGSSGETHHRPGLVMERFTRASPLGFDANRHVKTIARPARVTVPSCHWVDYAGGGRVVSADGLEVANADLVEPREASYAVAQVNHYFVRSRDEWADKLRRGYPDATVRDPTLFESFDRNEIEDRTILRRRGATRRWMARIGAKRRARWFASRLA